MNPVKSRWLGQVLWYMPLIPALGMQRLADLDVVQADIALGHYSMAPGSCFSNNVQVPHTSTEVLKVALIILASWFLRVLNPNQHGSQIPLIPAGAMLK